MKKINDLDQPFSGEMLPKRAATQLELAEVVTVSTPLGPELVASDFEDEDTVIMSHSVLLALVEDTRMTAAPVAAEGPQTRAIVKVVNNQRDVVLAVEAPDRKIKAHAALASHLALQHDVFSFADLNDA